MNRKDILEQVLLLLMAKDIENHQLRMEYADALEANGKKNAAKIQRDFVKFAKNFLKRNEGSILHYVRGSPRDQKQTVYAIAMDKEGCDKYIITINKLNGKVSILNYTMPGFMVRQKNKKQFNSSIKRQRNHRLQVRFQRIKEGLPHT